MRACLHQLLDGYAAKCIYIDVGFWMTPPYELHYLGIIIMFGISGLDGKVAG